MAAFPSMLLSCPQNHPFNFTNYTTVNKLNRTNLVLAKSEDKVFDYKNGKSRVQSYIDRIRAIPSSQILRIFDKVDNLSDFNDLLMALFIANEHDIALKLFDNLSSYCPVPDSRTLSTVIRVYCHQKNPVEAKRVLDYMLENGNNLDPPNVATFTMVINSFCKRGKLQRAFEVLEIMKKFGVKPSVQTYNCLMKGLCYVGRIEEAYELLMKLEKKADIYSFTAVMDGFCKVGRTEEAMELLNKAMEMGLIPNAVTFNALFNGYCKEGRPVDGIRLLKQMNETNCSPDYISYITLFHGLLKWCQMREALEIYTEMVRIGFDVDERMMNTLLRGLCRRSWKDEGMLKDAYGVFEKMRNGYSVIYPCAYDLVIQTMCIGKESSNALVNLQDMIRIGYSPRMITFNSVMRAVCEEGKADEALLVLLLACERGRIPSRICYKLLIDELNQQGRWFDARSVYGAALKVGVIPNSKLRNYSVSQPHELVKNNGLILH